MKINALFSHPFFWVLVVVFLLSSACQQAAEPAPDEGPIPTPAVEENETPDEPRLDPADESQTEPESATPAAPAEGSSIPGRIALIDLDGRLVTMSPTGQDRRVLSEENAVFQFPAWSPVENTIAAIGSSRDEGVVYVFADEDGVEPLKLYGEVENNPIYLYWQPNGEAVSFIARNGADLGFHLVPADGSSVGEVLATGQPFYWQWLPNNKQALIHAGTDRLSFLDLNGNEDLTGLGRDGIFQAPAISADNRYIAYQQVSSDGRTIQIKDLRADQLVLDASHDGILAMGWHPTAAKLAFTDPQRSESFFGPLLLWDGDSGVVETLVGDDIISFFWSPDGRFIAFYTTSDLGQETQSYKLRRSRPALQNRPFLTLGVVNIESGAVRYLARFEPTRLSIGQFIPFFDQYALSHRLWSPDSQYVLLAAVNNDDVPEVMVIPIDGRPAITIGEGVSGFWSYR